MHQVSVGVTSEAETYVELYTYNAVLRHLHTCLLVYKFDRFLCFHKMYLVRVRKD